MITTGTVVKLHGKLAQELGREEWEFLIERPREAIAALEANTGKLHAFLRREKTEYRILIDGKDLDPWNPNELPAQMWASGDFRQIDILPVPAGAGAGLWQAIIGVVLIIVGVVLVIATEGTAAQIGVTLGIAGLGMLAGGIAAMLSPTPKLGAGPGSRNFLGTSEALQQKEEDSHNNPSYLFSGAANTTQQGGPVPLLYGEHITGSQLISMGIHAGSVVGSTVGSPRPPSADDPYYDLPIWALLAADPRAALIPTDRSVRQLAKKDLQGIADQFGIPHTYPMDWPQKHYRGHAIPLTHVRDFLYTESRLFNLHLRAIHLHSARRLYRVLGLHTIPDPSGTAPGNGLKHAGWKIVMTALAEHYT